MQDCYDKIRGTHDGKAHRPPSYGPAVVERHDRTFIGSIDLRHEQRAATPRCSIGRRQRRQLIRRDHVGRGSYLLISANYSGVFHGTVKRTESNDCLDRSGGAQTGMHAQLSSLSDLHRAEEYFVNTAAVHYLGKIVIVQTPMARARRALRANGSTHEKRAELSVCRIPRRCDRQPHVMRINPLPGA